tara:strand:+ start:689 stop:1441 length:753 start_codon:yes stop_codon:yes gene_type:complete
MLLFLYYVTLFYFSVFLLEILDKYNKNEFENLDDLKQHLMSKTFTAVSNYYRVKRLTMETYDKYLTNGDKKEDEEEVKPFLHLYSKDNKVYFNMSIENNKIIMNDGISLEDAEQELTTYIEFDSYFKELKKYSLKKLMTSPMDISNIVENFVNNDLKDGKLFLNIELVNGKLKNSDLVDLTSEIQKYFVEGNTILSRDFIEYILNNNMGIELNEDYSLNIMTRDVEMFCLTSVQKINLVRKDDVLGYEIV